MTAIEKEPKQSSSIHQRIRTAAFVPTEPQENKKFIYKARLSVLRYIGRMFASVKTRINKTTQGFRLKLEKVEFGLLTKEGSVWLIEAGIEGATANFATHYLLGLPFSLPMMFAHGIAIKQGLSVFRRLRNGPTTEVSKEHE